MKGYQAIVESGIGKNDYITIDRGDYFEGFTFEDFPISKAFMEIESYEVNERNVPTHDADKDEMVLKPDGSKILRLIPCSD